MRAEGATHLADTTILFGAGVGIPAGLPGAKQLIAAIADELVTDPHWAKVIVEAAQPDGPMRFETAMEWLIEAVDEELSLLAFFDDALPGPLHTALASAALVGAQLVTVNFDDLVERELAAAGATPSTVDAHAKGRVVRGRGPAVLKLHGTRVVHERGSVHPATQPLHATISEIVRRGGGFGLSTRAASRLRRAVTGRELIVVGYSGSDDLDVVPALAKASPERVRWLQHADAIDPARASPKNAARGVRDLLERWRRAGVPATYLEGDTVRFFERLGVHVPSPLDEREWQQRRDAWRARIGAWARRVRPDDPTGLGWVSLALGSIGDRERSVEAARASKASRRPDGLWSSQRRLYEIAQGVYLLPGQDAEAVRRHANKTRKAAAAHDDPRALADAEMLLARILLVERRHDEAEAALGRAQNALDRGVGPPTRAAYGYAYVSGLRARLCIARGEGRNAREAAVAAAKQFASLGGWSEESEALQLAGQAEWLNDRYPQSVKYLDRAITIARTGPFPDQLASALARRAMVTYDMGDVEATYRDAKEACEVALAHHLTDEVCEQLTMRATAANELSFFKDARRAFELAVAYGGLDRSYIANDIVLGLADSLLHGRRRAEALDILASHPEIVAARPWDVAHAETIRWRARAADAADADRAVARALASDPHPQARPALGILRLGIPGAAGEALLRHARKALAYPQYEPRLERLEAAVARAAAKPSSRGRTRARS
ncbi:MAG: SIR2 family protein [Actinomycetota bacterium]|nr:SIR2 family protein [Actinomycetota bacterium]